MQNDALFRNTITVLYSRFLTRGGQKRFRQEEKRRSRSA
ncbi:hypothetical protein SAMN04488128_101894 [Chitinophaga eiseniae]|uniref:Uncharacterized protein n=1 Tax=Chitinophaga eiseniae TaxID=634771 RepID=A0A1T4M1V2_9BACT|nr:hypothetical protein SAMN04488128_101894 [Chitinophaga eiseniae]